MNNERVNVLTASCCTTFGMASRSAEAKSKSSDLRAVSEDMPSLRDLECQQSGSFAFNTTKAEAFAEHGPKPSPNRRRLLTVFTVLSVFMSIGYAQTAPPDSITISVLKGVWVLDSMSCSLDGKKTESLFNATDSLIQITFLSEEHEIEAVWKMQSFRLQDKHVSQALKGYTLSENTLELVPDAGLVYCYGWILHASGVLELQRNVSLMQGRQWIPGKHSYYYIKQ
jgi:hypothetical protein